MCVSANYLARLNADIRIFEEWATEHGLKFSSSKTKAMIFSRKENTNRRNLYINGEQIEYVTSFKYLGVTIDNKLNWTEHINNVSKKATNIMAQCRRMMGKTWGLKPYICRWMYMSLIRPIIAYGSIVWIKALTQVTKVKKLEQVQRRACLATLNAMTSTPTAGMEVIIGLPPIQIYLKTRR